MKTAISSKRQEQGQSMVEMGVSLVLLLTLLAGAVDFGRIFFTYLSMRDAAQEGASYGVVAGVLVKEKTIAAASYCTEIISRSQQAMQGIPAVVTVTVNGAPCNAGIAMAPVNISAGKEIVVTVTFNNYPLTMPFIGAVLGRQDIDLSTTIRGSLIGPPYP